MNATQRGRRADALFYDKVSRADLCNKVALLESEVEDLKDEIYGLHCTIASLEAKNAKLRELVRGLHMAYVGALNECEAMNAGIIWEYCDVVETELAKSHARYEADRHRFDTAINELEIEVNK